MSEQVDKLGLDASQYIQSVEKVNDVLNAMKGRLDTIAGTLGDVSDGMGRVRVNIRDVDEVGNRLNATLALQDKQWKTVSSSISVNLAQTRAQIKAAEEAERKFQTFAARLGNVTKLEVEQIRKLTAEGTANLERLFRLIDLGHTKFRNFQISTGETESGIRTRGILGAEGESAVLSRRDRPDIEQQILAQEQAFLNASRAARATAQQREQTALLAVAIDNITIASNREQEAVNAVNAAERDQLQLHAALLESRLSSEIQAENVARQANVDLALQQVAANRAHLQLNAELLESRVASDIARENAEKAENVRLALEQVAANRAQLQLNAELLESQVASQIEKENAEKRENIQLALEQVRVNRENLRVHAAMTEARLKGAEAARLERSAEQLAAGLQTRFGGGAGPADPVVVTKNIGTISALVSKGQIEANRVIQIFDSIRRNSNEVFTGVEQRVATAARAITTNTQQAGRSFRQVQDDGERAGRGLNLSWQSLTRIFLVQTIHTAIGRLIAEIRSSIDAAAQFEIKISEIRTISQDNQLSFGQWSSEVRRLSDEFGNPILDVAAGLYETISNQIAKGAETTQFMTTAMEFARTTVATTAEAVDLLSSVINAYHLSVGDADRVSAVLFKTIDLGRVRASELAQSFGRVAGLAAPLGVSLEEVSASIATLTINGIKYNEAYTLVNNVLLKLLRPTKDMKELLTEWGFASGEAAISALGFQGVLQKLETTTGGSATEMGELFNQIRGIRGALGLTGSAFATFQRDLAEIRNSTSQYQAAQIIAAESAGRQFLVETNKIKNFFIKDFGEDIVNKIVSFTSSTDEAGKVTSHLADTVKTVVTIGKTAVEVISAYLILTRASAISTAVMNVALAGSTGGFRLASAAANIYNFGLMRLATTQNLLMLGIGLLIVGYNNQKAAESAAASASEELAARRAELVADATREFNANIDKQTQTYKDSLTERLKQTFTNVAATRKLDDELTKRQIENRVEIQKETKNIFDLEIKGMELSIQKLQQAHDTAIASAQGARDRIRDIQEGLQHSQFEREVGLASPEEAVRLRAAKIAELNRLANTRLSGAKTADQGKDALKQATQEQNEADRLSNDLLKEREETEKKHIETLAKIKELTARGGAAGVSREDRENAEAVARLQRINRPLKNAEANELRERQARLRDIKELHGDAESQRRQAEELDKLQKESQEEEKILKTLGPSKKLLADITHEHAEQVRVLKEFAQTQDAIAKKQEDQKKREQERLEVLKDLVIEIGKFKLPDEVKDAAAKAAALGKFDTTVGKIKTAGASPELLAQLSKERISFEREATLQIEKFNLDQTNERLQKQKELAVKAAEDIANRIKAINTRRTDDLQKIQDIVVEIQKFEKANTGIGTQFRSDFLQRAVEGLVKNQSSANFQSVQDALTETAVALQAAVSGSKEAFVKQPDAFGREGRSLTNILNDMQKALHELALSPAELTQAQAAQAAIDASAKQLGLQPVKVNLAATASDVDKFGQTFIKQVQNQTQTFSNLEAAVNAASARLNVLGGQIPHKALGGLTRGTDTIPAMLSPGEFVVNAAATRRHLKELKSMNSLSYLAGGGYVSPQRTRLDNLNFNTGDSNSYSFHISAHAGPNGQVDVDSLGRELMRRVRNRTLDFSKKD